MSPDARAEAVSTMEIGVVVRDRDGNVKSTETKTVSLVEAFLGHEAYKVYKQCKQMEEK